MNKSSFETHMFDLAPTPMWIEDYSGLQRLFEQWRADGVKDIRTFLQEDTKRVLACSQAIRVVKVNRQTLELFEARDTQHLIDNISAIFREDMLESYAEEMAQIFEGKLTFVSNTVNYTLTGKRLDIQLRGTVLPGYEESLGRVVVVTENVTALENTRRNEKAQALYAKGLFDHSPVSLWVEDFSRIRILMDELRQNGIVDFRVFTDVHPEFVRECMSEIRVIDVNHATLDMFHAPDRTSLLQNQHKIFRGDMEEPFREQLIDLWEGKLTHKREVMNYTLDGDETYVVLQFSVFPGHEHDWSLVQVSLTDITARKKAESYLEYLGKHDVLTKLYNRAFYTDELNRLERKSVRPIGIIIIDLNGLKLANDVRGHAAGDGLLRRLGEVFNTAVKVPYYAARIGGDEFAVLMPGATSADAEAMLADINRLLHLNNQYYSNATLSISAGIAICEASETLESAVRRADAAMYEQKRAFYAAMAAAKISNKDPDHRSDSEPENH